MKYVNFCEPPLVHGALGNCPASPFLNLELARYKCDTLYLEMLNLFFFFIFAALKLQHIGNCGRWKYFSLQLALTALEDMVTKGIEDSL